MSRQQLENAVNFINKNDFKAPKCGIILGSGLGDFADTFDAELKIPTAEIPHYPKSTVEGHSGYLVFGAHEGIPLMAVQGRTHFYEGYSMREVAFAVRIMQELSIELLIVTNAAGGVNTSFKPGNLMLITDHVNFLFDNPLTGSVDFGGDRFPDMSDAYTAKYFSPIEALALKRGITLKRGVLWSSTGPSYETRAEVNMIRRLGGDAASMSTAPEVIAAVQAGMEVIGISCITNYATGGSPYKLTHEEVTETANLVKKSFTDLLSGIIVNIVSHI